MDPLLPLEQHLLPLVALRLPVEQHCRIAVPVVTVTDVPVTVVTVDDVPVVTVDDVTVVTRIAVPVVIVTVTLSNGVVHYESCW